jgi:hypothetical protein
MNDIALTLTGDEALVLFEWLSRGSDLGEPAPFEDQAEARVLWNVHALLESSLTAPFAPDYGLDSTP